MYGALDRVLWKATKKAFFVKNMNFLKKSPELHRLGINFEDEMKRPSLIEYVYEAQWRINGYEGRKKEYFEEHDISKHSDKINIPTFIYNARDDPICGENVVDVEKLIENDKLLVG